MSKRFIEILQWIALFFGVGAIILIILLIVFTWV